MLIENLTNYCDMNYRQKCLNENCGYCNTSCSHPTVCPQDCEQCLEQIHFPSRHPNGRLDYTCNNVLNFYVCKDYFKSTSYNPEYICTDVFEIFKDHYTVDKNLLILQYLISHSKRVSTLWYQISK